MQQQELRTGLETAGDTRQPVDRHAQTQRHVGGAQTQSTASTDGAWRHRPRARRQLPGNASVENTQEAAVQTEAQMYLSQGYYDVQKGDSLVGICRKIYQTTAMLDKLCEVNGIEDENAIYAGQRLILPN